MVFRNPQAVNRGRPEPRPHHQLHQAAGGSAPRRPDPVRGQRLRAPARPPRRPADPAYGSDDDRRRSLGLADRPQNRSRERTPAGSRSSGLSGSRSITAGTGRSTAGSPTTANGTYATPRGSDPWVASPSHARWSTHHTPGYAFDARADHQPEGSLQFRLAAVSRPRRLPPLQPDAHPSRAWSAMNSWSKRVRLAATLQPGRPGEEGEPADVGLRGLAHPHHPRPARPHPQRDRPRPERRTRRPQGGVRLTREMPGGAVRAASPKPPATATPRGPPGAAAWSSGLSTPRPWCGATGN